MEDEAAEIELLEQNLNKTRQISQRMISILTNFDSRLNKLEKTILPLHTATQILNRRTTNIDSTLQLIDEVASSQEGLAAEEALILRGPQSTELRLYIEALDRMNATIAFKGADGDSRDTARLVETGAKKLAQLYTKLVAESTVSNSPPSLPAPSFPQNLLSTLLPLVQYLRTLPLPSTHPSHPAANTILGALQDAQRGYADMRGAWVRKCVDAEGRRAVDRVEKGRGSGGEEFVLWVENVLDLVETEHQYLTTLALLQGNSQFTATYSTLITPLNTTFTSLHSQLLNTIKRSLYNYTFSALTIYTVLSDPNVTGRWDDLMHKRAGRGGGTGGGIESGNQNALRESLHALRGVCLRSFPEFLADVKIAAMSSLATAGLAPGAVGAVQTGVIEITEKVVRYMEGIPAVQESVASMLLTLGDGNWKMGEGAQVGKGQKLGEGDESIVLEHYLYDVIMTTTQSLTALSRTARRQQFGATFLLNNISYLRDHIILSSSQLTSLLAPPAVDSLQSSFRTAKAAYFESHFTPLITALNDDPKEKSGLRGGGSSAAKEKFVRFYELLDDVVETHQMARLLPDDPDGRENIVEEVIKLVVPSLRRFIQKNKEKEFSKNPQKYIKLSPEEVENRLREIA